MIKEMRKRNDGKACVLLRGRSASCIRRYGADRRGQISLPFVLLVGGIIVEIALAGIFTAYFLSTGNLGERLSARASSAAHSGLQDAMVKIAQNKELGKLGDVSYMLEVKMDEADVLISREVDAGTNSYTFTVNSLGTAGNRKEKLQGILIVSRTTGKVMLRSIEKISAS